MCVYICIYMYVSQNICVFAVPNSKAVSPERPASKSGFSSYRSQMKVGAGMPLQYYNLI